jgi:hypothetical protein
MVTRTVNHVLMVRHHVICHLDPKGMETSLTLVNAVTVHVHIHQVNVLPMGQHAIIVTNAVIFRVHAAHV